MQSININKKHMLRMGEELKIEERKIELITNQLANQCMVFKPGISEMSHPRIERESRSG